ncbi:hypothetical protein FAF44_33195 [Nonomuraea sp. MG754425]|uniref:hypothetical protein n=1 Tax=Nonomuraea sp. MG754425 TaxID=2570319 RepID=UPI001F47ADF6|nr:hypothetical protein [Nonomuraea sp. MG754425]MCF6473204.1 hypothetical protein [Nonomuraea sp. MG754425]
MSDHGLDRIHQLTSFPIQFTAHVTGSGPEELRIRAAQEAVRFFGADAEVYVVSAASEADPGHDGRYRATVVFRQVADGSVI